MHTHRQSIVSLFVMLTVAAGAAQREPGRIGMDAFMRMHAMKGALVIDVRSTDAYRAGHIPGALHVPLDQVASRADEIRALAKPPHQIVAYCSCPEEHASLAAVSILAEHGMPNASALVGGFGEWVKRGGRVERSTFLVPRSSFPFPFSFSFSFPFWNRPGDERLAEQRDIARIRSEQPEEHADGGALTRAVLLVA